METLRTPDERFEGLPDWPYAPRYVDDLPGYEGLRVHYVDEGPKDAAQVFLCLHGEPSWAFLYRKMIPPFLESGARVVAPDFLGFGRSDKPVDDAVYTVDFHRDMLLALIDRLGLEGVTLVVQDWGGLIGLTLPVDRPDLVSRLLIMNTGFGVGMSPSPGFLAWRAYAASTPDMPVGQLFKRGKADMTDAEVAAYDAPFPDARHKAGVRRFPQLVPVENDADPFIETSKRAQAWWRAFQGPVFMAVGMADPVLGPPVMAAMRKNFPTCPPPLEIAEGGHFVQEHGEEIARAALEAWA
jgi:pimeloyl-ACP methyl ester carboxylesterase